MTIWMSPKYNDTNKYNSLLCNAIEKKGVLVNHFRWRKFFSLKRNDVLHLHWIDGVYQSNIKVIFMLRILILFLMLMYFKLLKVRVVWTVHNLYPHNYKYKRLEKIARRLVIKFCSKLIVAGEFIKREVVNEFSVSPNKISVIPHGHYKNVYPIQGLSYRKKYKIPESDYVYLFIGSIKPYKGIEKLIEAFNNIDDNNSSSLLIAGKLFVDETDLTRLINKNKKIHCDFNFISDEQIADIILSADAIVLPFIEITTSGSALLAPSFNRPIIAPRSSFFEEYFDKTISVLYDDSSSVESLKKAMQEVRNLNIKDEAFIPLLSKLDWDSIADQTIACYKNIKNNML